MCDGLSEAGLSVIEARNGDEALDLLEHEHVDVVITDVNMPGAVNGLELAHRVRRDRPNVEVLIVSGHAQGKNLPLGVSLMRKPYSIKDVVQIAWSLLS